MCPDQLFRERNRRAGYDTTYALHGLAHARPARLAPAPSSARGFESMKQLALVLVATMALGLPARAWAQAAVVDWADVDCSQSRIWPTMGLHCRATSALTNDALATGQGMFRF